ncbi:hypothetical protein C9426_28280 [Serratia sp. S1B]|nr:hypothetical protein C9426_28280 [Serratia sp. S1B]
MKKLAIFSLTAAGFAFSAVGCASHEVKPDAPTTTETSPMNASADNQMQDATASDSASADTSMQQTLTPAANTPATNVQ